MKGFSPIRTVPKATKDLGPGDLLVVFGELFDRGYANGVVEYAQSLGMSVVTSTVGRRDGDLTLRPLTETELLEKRYPVINIPLEAGFDLDQDPSGQRPVDQLKAYGLNDWVDAKLNWSSIEQSQRAGQARFRKATQVYLRELEPYLSKARSVVFLHTMAGGFPRAKVVMPIANKVFKGSGDRYQSSRVFWESDIGRLCDLNFNEVTADTFQTLIDLTANIREKVKSKGGQVSYLAFGYHGNEVMIGEKYEWYSYSPYLQGWAKVRLEDHAKRAAQSGVLAKVFNVPEILTNSSSIFLGVEVVLYPLMRSLLKRNPNHPMTQKLLRDCESKLAPPYTYSDVDNVTQAYLTDPVVRKWPQFADWPQHNGPDQMAKMRETSTKLIEMHKDRKDLMTSDLSELVFRACGTVMLRDSLTQSEAVQWIGHDLVTTVALSS